MKVSNPVEPDNRAVNGSFSVIPKILKKQKSPTTYFATWDGKRTGILIAKMSRRFRRWRTAARNMDAMNRFGEWRG